MAKRKYTAKEVIEATKGTYGIMTKIASNLGCSRMTVDNYYNRYKTVKQAIDNERNKLADSAEAKTVQQAFQEGKRWALKMILRNLHPDYMEKKKLKLEGKLEHDIPEGSDFNINVIHTEEIDADKDKEKE